MKKKEKFIKTCDLSVSHVLLGFVNKELLPGTGISSNQFWKDSVKLYMIYHKKIKDS